LAKIASDWKKPDGLFVVQPEEVDSFLLPLPVGRIPGVGKVTEDKLKQLAVETVGDLRRIDLAALENRFGRYGARLYELARETITAKSSRTGQRNRYRPRILLQRTFCWPKRSR